MPRFTKLNPDEVVVGRGRAAFEARKLYVEAVKAGDAGRIDLESGDRPAAVKRSLLEAAREAGVKVRSTWTDGSQKSLLWKRPHSSRQRGA